MGIFFFNKSFKNQRQTVALCDKFLNTIDLFNHAFLFRCKTKYEEPLHKFVLGHKLFKEDLLIASGQFAFRIGIVWFKDNKCPSETY